MRLPRVYPILDLDSCRQAGIRPQDLLAGWAEVGLDFFQLRAKSFTQAQYMQLASRYKTEFPELRMMANDWVAAMQSPEIFCGMHLGQNDWARLSKQDRLTMQNQSSDFILGLSTHTTAEIEQACLPEQVSWTYLTCGPCYATDSKKDHEPILSRASRQELIATLHNAWPASHALTPQIVFIGGLNAKRITEIHADLVLWQETTGKRVHCSFAGIGLYQNLNQLQQIQEIIANLSG